MDTNERVAGNVAFYVIFFIAGVPALMYQVVWQRVMSLYFGVDIYSTSVTVSTFMLGLGVGSLLGGFLADRTARPAFWYAGVEMVLAVFGALSLPLFSKVGGFLKGSPLMIVIPINICLLIVPTVLMGMTFPLMCKILRMTQQAIGKHLSGLYSVNTLGAAVGALVSAYLVIGVFGLKGATYVAAALNTSLAVLMYGLSVRPYEADILVDTLSAVPAKETGKPGLFSLFMIYVFSFLSGFIALGYEMIWYRLLGCILHGTVYVFGTILFFHLVGIALGSYIARKRIDRGDNLQRFLWCQIGIALYVYSSLGVIGRWSWLPGLRHLIAASFFTTFHPSPELVSGTFNLFSVYSLLDIALWAMVILLFPSILMGYGFPNLMRAGSRQLQHLGRNVGSIYCVNIVGSTLGSLFIGFVALHFWGSEFSARVVIMLGCMIPLLFRIGFRKRTATVYRNGIFRQTYVVVAGLLIILVIVAFPGRSQIIQAIHYADYPDVEYLGKEDRTGVVVLRKQKQVITFSQEAKIAGIQRLYIDGAAHGTFSPKNGSSPDFDTSVQAALAAHSDPRRVLAIGLGDGRMCMTAALWDSVQELVIVELNNSLRNVLEKTSQGQHLFNSQKITYIVDDGRRWLLANPHEQFDLIIMWPLHAAHAYYGNLFSVEFLNILNAHLSHEGILFLRTADMYATAKTVATVFPYVLRLGHHDYLASASMLRLDVNRLGGSVEEVLKRIQADREMILVNTADAPLNYDFTPNSEYYITYPYAWVLQTWGQSKSSYTQTNLETFRRYVKQ